jgi:hypothetical protein
MKHRKFGNQKVTKVFEKMFGKGETITVPMLYEKEVSAFLKTIEDAHKQAAKSKLIFKGALCQC